MPENDALAATLHGSGSSGRPALVLMHFLGGSLRQWDEVIALLGDEYQTLALDLPGFGGSAHITGYSVAEMADAVQAAIAAAGLTRYVLVGHSMSAKVAVVIARRLEDAAINALAGMVLLASSPPGPEPMEDEKRAAMIALLGSQHEDDAVRARSYISKNELRDIPQDVEDRAVAEVLRMHRTAWTTWLTHGSREDWRDRVGILSLPTLVIAGEKDAALGPEGQQHETLPHLGNATLVVFENCSHLVPMEQPDQLADVLHAFVATLTTSTDARVFEVYATFLSSSRISAPTRKALQARMAQPKSIAAVLNAAQQRTLRAVLARVLPERGADAIDLSAYVMQRLAAGESDGWRYAVLGDDLTAYRAMLDRLDEKSFADAPVDLQDKLLGKLASIRSSPEARWFEDLRADAAAAWAAHPRTMARLGFSGPGVGGARTRTKGYIELRANRREPWEPVAHKEFRGDDAGDGR